MHSLYPTTTIVIGKSYMFILYTTLCTVYTWYFSISYVLLIRLTRRIYIFCYNKIFLLGKIKKKRGDITKYFCFMTGDESLQIGDCSLYGHVVCQWIRLKYYASLPVSIFTVAGDTRRATDTDHRTGAETVVFSKCAESAYRDHKPPPRVTLKCVLFVPSME